MSEVSAGLYMGSVAGTQVSAHELGAGCWWALCLYLSQPRVHGVLMCNHLQTLRLTTWLVLQHPQAQVRVRRGWSVHAGMSKGTYTLSLMHTFASAVCLQQIESGISE